MPTFHDYKEGNPQTETFTYDESDRLSCAMACGGMSENGDYSLQNYTSSPSTSNLSGKAGVS
jgi:hypothetical protein